METIGAGGETCRRVGGGYPPINADSPTRSTPTRFSTPERVDDLARGTGCSRRTPSSVPTVAGYPPINADTPTRPYADTFLPLWLQFFQQVQEIFVVYRLPDDRVQTIDSFVV